MEYSSKFSVLVDDIFQVGYTHLLILKALGNNTT